MAVCAFNFSWPDQKAPGNGGVLVQVLKEKRLNPTFLFLSLPLPFPFRVLFTLSSFALILFSFTSDHPTPFELKSAPAAVSLSPIAVMAVLLWGTFPRAVMEWPTLVLFPVSSVFSRKIQYNFILGSVPFVGDSVLTALQSLLSQGIFSLPGSHTSFSKSPKAIPPISICPPFQQFRCSVLQSQWNLGFGDQA